MREGHKMTELTANDLRFVVSRLPRDVRNMIMQSAGRMFVAGGFIRAVIAGETINDIDLFGTTEVFLQNEADKFTLGRVGSRKHSTKNAITVLSDGRLPVQFITRWTFSDADSCLASFDYTVCKAVVYFDDSTKTWRSKCADDFYIDLAARRLVYTKPIRDEEAGGSLMRAHKYMRRGYTIQPASLGAVICRLVDGIRDTGVDREQVIVGLLREVDPMLVLDGLDVIDEVHAH